MCSLMGVGRSAREGGRNSGGSSPPMAPAESLLAQLDRSPALRQSGDPLSVNPGGGVFMAINEKSMRASWSGVLGGGISVRSGRSSRKGSVSYFYVLCCTVLQYSVVLSWTE